MKEEQHSKQLKKLKERKPKQSIGEALLLASGRSKRKTSNSGQQKSSAATPPQFDIATLLPIKHEKSKLNLAAAVRKADIMRQRKQAFYKPTRHRAPAIPSVFSSTSVISNCFHPAAEFDYVSKYCDDLHLYQSRAVWALKTVSEVKQLALSLLPRNVFASVLTHLLIEAESLPPLSTRAKHSHPIDNLLRSVFVLGSSLRSTNLSTQHLLNNRLAKKKNKDKNKNKNKNKAEAKDASADPNGASSGSHWGAADVECAFHQEGVEGHKKKLKLILECPTWLDAVQYWEMRLKKEMRLQPYLSKLRKKMIREKKIENGVLNRTCTAWTRPYMSLILDSWKGECGMNHKLQLLGKYFLKCTELKPSHVFEVWKKWAYHRRLSRADEDRSDVIKKVEALKKELEETKGRVSKKKIAVSKAKGANRKIQKELDEALLILNSPPRQPPTLAKIVKKFSNSLTSLNDGFLKPFLHDCTNDIVLVAPHTLRLAPIFKWTHAHDELIFLPHPNVSPYEAKGEEADDTTENKINDWKPGQLKGVDEFTHAFAPSKTKSGKVVLKWLIMLLKQRWSRQGKSANADLLDKLVGGPGPGIVGADGVAFLSEIVQEVAKVHPQMSEKEILSSFDNFDLDDNSSIESMEDEVYLAFHEKVRFSFTIVCHSYVIYCSFII